MGISQRLNWPNRFPECGQSGEAILNPYRWNPQGAASSSPRSQAEAPDGAGLPETSPVVRGATWGEG